MNETELIKDSYRNMASDLRKVVKAIDNTVQALCELPERPTKQQLKAVSDLEKKISEGWKGFAQNTLANNKKAVILLQGISNRN